ncbi:MAG: phosphatidate cytidylyltransferase [Cyanobacteria bacterium CRU_2_1]|nr:phosphatidate cytidylyltransferase [Cyanobacteria bacterium CRU_2_1]
MLLRYYLFCLLCVFITVGVSLSKKNKETIVSALTALAILHVTVLAFWQGALSVGIAIAIILAIGLYELSKYYPINRTLFIVTTLAFFLVSLFSDRQFVELAIPAFAMISVVTFKSDRQLITSNSYLFAFVSCLIVTCSLFLIKLAEIDVGIIIFLLLLVQLNDSFGYLFGKQFGKTYLFQSISPKKSLEGYLFSGIGIILGIVLFHTYIPMLSSHPFYQDIILFVYILIFANLGDLLFSSLKRKLQTKDFCGCLPGHGGVLDRFDSLLFIAPIFYLLVAHHVISFGG